MNMMVVLVAVGEHGDQELDFKNKKLKLHLTILLIVHWTKHSHMITTGNRKCLQFGGYVAHKSLGEFTSITKRRKVRYILGYSNRLCSNTLVENF
jgi:hypothetical protein